MPPTRRTALAAGSALVASAALGQPKPASGVVEGYTDQLSYAAGETVKFHTSTESEEYEVQIARLGVKRVVVETLKGVAGKKYPVPKDASSHGCKWPKSIELKIPSDWKSGYYTVRFTPTGASKPSPTESFFVVRPKEPGKNAKVLLQLSTNTYNAYTNWGGYSLYAYNGRHKAQGRRVSFDRPLSSQFGNWEHPFVAWAEASGYSLDFCVNSDLEYRPELLKHYKLVLSVGHDEYWSKPMRDNLEKYIGDGGNVAFFSGNTCCWQVRSEDDGRSLTCWKQNFGDDPHYKQEKFDTLSTAWSHYLINRPENSLTGVGFLWGGYRKSHGQFMDDPAEFTVHRPGHWLFADTAMNFNDKFGGKDTVVGYECDGCELTWQGDQPTPTYKDGTPKGFQVLATCPVRWHPDDCEWYEKWEKGRLGHAVVGTYTRGGTVVTVGTTDWSHGLRGNDPVVVQVTKNILDKLGK